MKRLLCLLLLFSVPAFCADEPRSIQVSGNGIVKTPPDQVTLQLGIESINQNLIKAKDDNTQKTKAVLDALKKFNIPSKDIQTGYAQINARYDYVSGRQVLAGYAASKQLTVTLKDLNDYGKVLNAAVEAGADHVNGVQFSTSKTDELKVEARKRAVNDAKAKAEFLAAQLNQKIGQPLLIQEGEVPMVSPMFRGSMMAAQAIKGEPSPEDTLSAGEITVGASVTVRFQLQ